VLPLAAAPAAPLGVNAGIDPGRVVAHDGYVGDGYGVPTAASTEAIRLLAEEEGILLDPVYSAKGMAGLIDLVREGHFRAEDNVVFLHTGGAMALFAYEQDFAA
jgi:L-cysteate sulfo-lyase